MSDKQSELICAVTGLKLTARYSYYLQCTHPIHPGWFDWMPDNVRKTFSFEADANEEVERLQEAGTPYGRAKWRVVLSCTIDLPLG